MAIRKNFPSKFAATGNWAGHAGSGPHRLHAAPVLLLPGKPPTFRGAAQIGPAAEGMRISPSVRNSRNRYRRRRDVGARGGPARPRILAEIPAIRGALSFAEDLVAAYFCAFDRNTPRRVQVALIGALAYFVLPFDFIPDMLPVIGFTDDAAVLATAIRLVAVHITPQHRDAARRVLARAAARSPHFPAHA